MKTSTEKLTEAVQPGAPLYQLETLTNGEIVTFGGVFLSTEKMELLLVEWGLAADQWRKISTLRKKHYQ